MSMEICVLSDKQLQSIAEWQGAINTESFPLRLSNQKAFTEINGFLPAWLREQRTGFECYHVEPSEIIDTYNEINFGHDWKYVLVFIWGGDSAQMQAAWMAATAYARVTEGIVFDNQAGELLSPTQSLQELRKIERELS
jgi:hypothetical protein